MTTAAPLLEVEGLVKHYPIEKGVLRRRGGAVRAVDGVSLAIAAGERRAIIGPNGAGKTTLLRILLGDLAPQEGAVRHGTNLQIAYFDQLHESLDDGKSLRDNITGGHDRVDVGGRSRHVVGYLQEFLFTPAQASSLLGGLSGGERNRLLLARILARPSNVLVLDEPTNDLDMETLDLLVELLHDYPGTVLAVSHDRQFLDDVVTSTLVFEAEGAVEEYVGGYSDWIRQRPQPAPPPPPRPASAVEKRVEAADRPQRLNFKERRELEGLPKGIEDLEAEKARILEDAARPDFFRGAPTAIAGAMRRLHEIEEALVAAYGRWQELEERDR
jgi:ATP-binding cassette subfamily F protein uup